MKKYLLSLAVLSMVLMSWQVRAVDYQLTDLNGKTQSLEQYRGKWLVVNYWATWCTTCMKEMPDLVSLHKDNKDSGVVVVGINFEEISLTRLKMFTLKNDIPYLVLRDRPVDETPVGKVPALPTTYIINPEGKVVAGQVGLVTKEQIESFINEQRNSKSQASL